MKELLNSINTWSAKNKKMVLARVIQTWGSSPRPVGSSMLISDDMEMAGSVSGGCVEGAVLREAKSIMGSTEGKKLSFGVSDDDAWAVGLSCGGKIQVYIQPWFTASDPKQIIIAETLLQCLKENKSCILVSTLVDGTTKNTLLLPSGKIFGNELPKEVIQKSLAFEKRTHENLTVGADEYFIHVFPQRSQMIIIGAAHITADLVKFAHEFDFETIVIDPRGTFAKNTAFTIKPDQLFEKYPSEVLSNFELGPYTYAVILSHDPKIDDDALQILLKKKVAYIGALGSKKNHEKRTSRLLEKGFTSDEISRIDAPIGLDIHAKGAKEIAFSIMGAVIKAKNIFL